LNEKDFDRYFSGRTDKFDSRERVWASLFSFQRHRAARCRTDVETHEEKFVLATARNNRWITIGFILGMLLTISYSCNKKKQELQPQESPAAAGAAVLTSPQNASYPRLPTLSGDEAA
jgi:hypothetical protein